MEALLSSGNAGGTGEYLVGPLKFGLDPQGSYVTARRSSTTFSNVNSASPSGVKSIQINCGSSSEWLDPSTVLLNFLITNTDATNALWPATPSASVLFDRLQVRLGSTLCEDIQEFGKPTHIMEQLSMHTSEIDWEEYVEWVENGGGDEWFQEESTLYCTKHKSGPLDVWFDCDACQQEVREGPMPRDGRYMDVPVSSINGQGENTADLR